MRPIILSLEHDAPIREIIDQLRQERNNPKPLFTQLKSLEACIYPDVSEFFEETEEFIDDLFCWLLTDLSIISKLISINECLYDSLSFLKKVGALRNTPTTLQ